MALTESDIKIIIAAELKKAGFDKAKKATSELDKSFKKLGKTAAKTFIAIAGARALKQSIVAYAQEDKAVKSLTNSLKNLGLGYNTTAIENFISKTEQATAINKDQLRPAMVQLVTTTLDAQKSMKLLNTALDISAGTGASLDSAINALSKAFNGNFASLGKLQTAYTTSELEAMGFEKSVMALNDLFKGSAKTSADSYAGKLEKLKIAADNAKQEIGKGLVDAISLLANGNFDSGLQKIVDFGEKIGDVFQRAAISIRYAKELLSTGLTIDPEERKRLDELTNLLRNPDAITNQSGNNPAANRQFLAEYRKQLALQKKIQADRKKSEALSKKAELDRLKREKEAQQLKRAGTIFDMENIQIVAAMQGKIDGEQRLRLVALFALNNDIADAAEKAATAVLALNKPALANLGVMFETGDTIEKIIQKILVSQAKVALLDLGITNIPKAKNPFEAWDEIMKNIISQLDIIAAKIRSMPTVSGTPGGTTGGTTGGKIDTPGGTKLVESKIGGLPGAAISSLETHIQTLDVMRKEVGVSSALGIKLKEQTDEYRDMITYGSEALGTVVDERTKRLAMAALAGGTIGVGSPFDPARFRMGENADLPMVNVYVQGSVISQQDLVETISDQLYNYQKAGKGLLVSSTAI